MDEQPATPPYRIVLADPHPLFREGIKRILQEGMNLEIVGEAAHGQGLYDLIARTGPDLVILDVSIFPMNAEEALRELKNHWPRLKIMVLTAYSPHPYSCREKFDGVEAYLLKESSLDELFAAIGALRNGQDYQAAAPAPGTGAPLGPGCRSQASLADLSPREKEVLKYLLRGKENREIAALLAISVRTVEHHRASIMRKLKTKKFPHLVRNAVQNGYFPISP